MVLDPLARYERALTQCVCSLVRAGQEVGIPHPPEIQFLEIHSYLAGGRGRMEREQTPVQRQTMGRSLGERPSRMSPMRVSTIDLESSWVKM